MQQMQESHQGARPLLTALEVQDLLHIDRSTVYRMAEDGRLPAIRVGRSWRFPADGIAALLDQQRVPLPGTGAVPSPTPRPDPQRPGSAAPLGTNPGATPAPTHDAGPAPAGTGPALDVAVARAATEVAADLLGVMMVVTDMHGRPLTDVSNPCPWFAEHGDDPAVLDRCVAEWHDLADHPDLTPRFQAGALGFQCARAFIRDGSTLVGMVLAGGVSPEPPSPADPPADAGLYHLDDGQRERVLAALPRIAAAIAPTAPRPAATTTTAPHAAAATKEH
ncbi:MAG TPA: helix-turn-helix domain-containing protein [Candidatus Nanopelagicales bacterium]